MHSRLVGALKLVNYLVDTNESFVALWLEGALLVVEPQEGKERMRKKKYAQHHGCTAACVLRLYRCKRVFGAELH